MALKSQENKVNTNRKSKKWNSYDNEILKIRHTFVAHTIRPCFGLVALFICYENKYYCVPHCRFKIHLYVMELFSLY